MTFRCLTLANGLRCYLHQQPNTQDAAALVRVAAGSLHEPASWPGLAHLLEHLLFCGSAGMPDEQRLMPWVQQQGGQVNATTLLSDSRFFFQLPARALEAGLDRLGDMLAVPTLSAEAIRQERAVIDAEYRLLQNHEVTLSEAALLDMAGAPAQLRRFRVGSQAAFGDSVTDLQSALRGFHDRHYVAENMTLWLQGPQSLAELTQLAQGYGQRMKSGPAPAIPLPFPSGGIGYRQLQLPGEEAFWLTFILPESDETLSDTLPLCRQFWLDEAPGSLLAQLRSAGLCEHISLHWIWRDGTRGWLGLKFTARTLSPGQAQAIEAQFRHHLRDLMQTRPLQRGHYQRLAREDFRQLTPLEQLRARADGFAPQPAERFDDGLRRLHQCPPRRLLVQRQVSPSRSHSTQGFTLQVADSPEPRQVSASPLPGWFYPLAQQPDPGPLPDARFPLLRLSPVQPQPHLLLRPTFYQPLNGDLAEACQRQLRPLLAALRHSGGRGSWQQVQGSWQLSLDLPPDSLKARAAVHEVVQVLRDAGVQPQSTRPPEGIAIRQLLAALPNQLLSASAAPGWHAVLCGEDRRQEEEIARVLSYLPPALPAAGPALLSGITAIPCPGRDHALLVFMSLIPADNASLAALQALALMYEPRFFQRLRVEQQIGYVVSARYQRMVDVDGILLALQSPDVPAPRLLEHCKDFLRNLDFSQVDLTSIRSSLRPLCMSKENASAGLRALRQQQGLAILSPEALDNLSVTQLEQLHRRLLQRHRQWRVLTA